MIDYWIPGYIERYQNDRNLIKEAEEVFFNKYTFHDDTITWMDNDLNQSIGIDVYNKSFPQTRMYQTNGVGEAHRQAAPAMRRSHTSLDASLRPCSGCRSSRDSRLWQGTRELLQPL